MSISRKVFGAAAGAALAFSLIACSPPNQQDSPEERSHEVLTTSQSPTPEETTSGESSTEESTPIESTIEGEPSETAPINEPIVEQPVSQG